MVLKFLFGIELCYLFTRVQILTPSLPGCVTLASGLTSSLGLLIHAILRGATSRDVRTTCIKCPAHSGAQLFLPEWCSALPTGALMLSSAWAPLLPAPPGPPLAVASARVFSGSGPDQLWPQAWPGSPLPVGKWTGNGGLQGKRSPSRLKSHSPHPSPASWPAHLKPMCVLSWPGVWVPCFMAS